MKIGEIYKDCISGDKYKVHKVYDNTDVAEAGNIDRLWEVVSITPKDVMIGKYELVKGDLPKGDITCLHDWKVYTGLIKVEWECTKCGAIKPWDNGFIK